MKKLIIILMVGSLFAQYLPDVSNMSEVEKMMVFENNKKSVFRGVLYSGLLTSTGHAYSGKWKRGLLFSGARVGAFIIAEGFGYSYDEYAVDEDGVCCGAHVTNEIFYIGYGVLGVLSVWEMIDAGSQVKEYNNKLYKEIFGKEPPSFSMKFQPTYQGANLTMSYSFN